MLIIIALITWLVINYIFWWFTFSSMLCAWAGLFLIMPSLLNVKFSELKSLVKHKKLFFINILLNFIIIPLVFFWIAKLFFGTNPIIYSFLLLWVMAWGWLTFAWIAKTKWDIKVWFWLFLTNIILFSAIFVPLNSILNKIGNYYFLNPLIQEQTTGNIFKLEFIPYTITNHNCFLNQIASGIFSCFSSSAWPSPLIAFFALIIIPMIISRLILLSSNLTAKIKPYIGILWKASSFFIIAYIFSLKEVNKLFSINFEYLLKITTVLIIAYLIIFAISYLIFKKSEKTPENISLFWNTTTRFITLGLVFSFSFSGLFGLGFMIVFILSYFVQILLSNRFSYIITKKEEA